MPTWRSVLRSVDAYSYSSCISFRQNIVRRSLSGPHRERGSAHNASPLRQMHNDIPGLVRRSLATASPRQCREGNPGSSRRRARVVDVVCRTHAGLIYSVAPVFLDSSVRCRISDTAQDSSTNTLPLRLITGLTRCTLALAEGRAT